MIDLDARKALESRVRNSGVPIIRQPPIIWFGNQLLNLERHRIKERSGYNVVGKRIADDPCACGSSTGNRINPSIRNKSGRARVIDRTLYNIAPQYVRTEHAISQGRAKVAPAKSLRGNGNQTTGRTWHITIPLKIEK